MPLPVIVSGLHSGPNPSSGIGVARSLRAALPDSFLIGLDYSGRSTGVSWQDFDDVWIYPPWSHLDLSLYAQHVFELLNAGFSWVSNLDLESYWLSSVIGLHPNLLVPPLTAIELTSKPGQFVADLLGIRVPPTTSFRTGLDEVSRFFLHWGSDVWVKGPWYEGVRARDWQAVLSAKKRLEATWGLARPLLVQSHIEGTEESIAFCSVSGQLLDAVYMRKRDTTPEGKTWSGSIVPVPADLREQLSHFAALLSWTGGGEIEMIRDRDGQLWLLELNPRFPAWIFGATLAGFNLPSQLVLRQQNHFGSKDFGSPFQFTRVVLEIPVKVPDFML